MRQWRRAAAALGVIAALFVAGTPSMTAYNQVYFAGRPDDDTGHFPRVFPHLFRWYQRHHACALIVNRTSERFGVTSHLCEFPSPRPNWTPPGGNRNS